jgi:polyhydroxyalkanoate synthase
MTARPELFDPFGLSNSVLRLAQSWAHDPTRFTQGMNDAGIQLSRSWLDEMNRMTQEQARSDAVEFEDQNQRVKTWCIDTARRNQRLLRAGHGIWSSWIRKAIADAPALDSADRERCHFWFDQFLGAVAPSNLFWANPGAVQRCLDTDGESIGQGYSNWMRDLRERNGLVATVDRERFKVGVNVAATPGRVVHRNRLLELIQYTPSTTQVHQIPIVFIPPWINKFYILDLAPERSMIAWLRDQGFRVFTVSWRNPDASMQDLGFEDYAIHGALDAIEAARSIAGTEAVHAVGFCIGGTALASLMAWLSADDQLDDRGQRTSPVAHWTLFNTLVDFSNPGELAHFTSPSAVACAETLMEREGYLDGSITETVFRLLRPDSLIWHHAVRNYLYGDTPSQSDVLYWNSDSTRLTKRMLTFYLREFYLNNALVSERRLTLAGRTIQLETIEQPLYVVGCVQDHITPWTETFRIREHLPASICFTLSSEGHIAGILNPPSAKSKRQFWSDDVPPGTEASDWLAAQACQRGSWWPHWAEWLAARCGPLVTATALGSEAHPLLDEAPGTYVMG